MPIIETETWKPNPDRPGTVIFDSQRTAKDVFNELVAHLKADGRMPDEYFLLKSSWENGALYPQDADVLCHVNYGGSEGIYLDIALRYEKEMYEHSRETGDLGWHKRPVIEPFATGKTLGDTIDDLDRMNLTASSVTAAFYGYMSEVKARYIKIEQGAEQPKTPPAPATPGDAAVTAKTIFGDVQPGDWVIAAGNNDYRYLIGIVKAIDKLGTPEHDTDNETDDVHVDFTAFDYPAEHVKDIEDWFSDIWHEETTFDDIPLDDVIMAPKMLIRITHLGQDEIDFMGNLRVNCESFCNCFPSGIWPDGKHGELIERLEQNHESYFDSLQCLGKDELIRMSDKTAAMSSVFSYLSYRGFDDDELDFLLRFQNPLEVVADGWLNYSQDTSDEMYYAFDSIMGNKEVWLESHPLIAETADAPTAAMQGFLESAESVEDSAVIGTQTSLEKPPADKKTPIGERIKAGNEKVKEYKEQKTQNPQHASKNEKEIY